MAGLASCRRTYNLSEGDSIRIPYKGKEHLTFISPSGKIQEIQLNGYHSKTIEQENANCERLSLNFASDDKDVPELSLFCFLQASSTGKSLTLLSMWYPGKLFYSKINTASLDSFPNLKSFQVSGQTYSDVIVSKNIANNHSCDSSFCEMYWSKSKGLIAYKLCGELWQLKNQ
jgi:hypothetical protein